MTTRCMCSSDAKGLATVASDAELWIEVEVKTL